MLFEGKVQEESLNEERVTATGKSPSKKPRRIASNISADTGLLLTEPAAQRR